MTEVLTLTDKDAPGFEKVSTFAVSHTNFENAQGTTATLMAVPDQLLYAGAIHPQTPHCSAI